MNSKVVSREELKLKDDPKLLSPPAVDEPLYQCGTAVTVLSYEINAKIEIEIAGSILPSVTGGFPMPNGVSVALPNPLVAGQKVRAQTNNPNCHERLVSSCDSTRSHQGLPSWASTP